MISAPFFVTTILFSTRAPPMRVAPMHQENDEIVNR